MKKKRWRRRRRRIFSVSPDQLLWTILPIIVMLAIGLISFGPKHDSSGLKGPDGIGKRAKDNRSGIVSFSYSYDDSIGGGAYSFRVDSGESGRTFTCEYRAFPDYGEMSCSIGEDVMRELEAIYADCRLAEWDGYHRYAEGVNDGWGFSLSIGFADGKSMSASGSNCSPEDYGLFTDRLNALFDPTAQRLLEETRQEKIGEGISGQLNSVLAVFMQRGDSGSDSYHILLTADKYRENNFDVHVTSDSGEFWDAGEYRYDMPYVGIDFAPIQALVEKYNLISWLDYDRTAEDYDNREWFQLSLGFDNGRQINAMGTEHPENYDAFRSEFLSLIADMARTAEAQSSFADGTAP